MFISTSLSFVVDRLVGLVKKCTAWFQNERKGGRRYELLIQQRQKDSFALCSDRNNSQVSHAPDTISQKKNITIRFKRKSRKVRNSKKKFSLTVVNMYNNNNKTTSAEMGYPFSTANHDPVSLYVCQALFV
ncbi:hypothetical protein CEXT_426581 [Caerostris extrusa]|uniref:Uncharacterized protein n=1 Tax=Caerostris extrusa TaxID=172846 RepID=A0AAV4Y4F2_CAEEX|nr:hypothetical protein CEXT_426581 [Caerostris extrusa]